MRSDSEGRRACGTFAKDGNTHHGRNSDIGECGVDLRAVYGGLSEDCPGTFSDHWLWAGGAYGRFYQGSVQTFHGAYTGTKVYRPVGSHRHFRLVFDQLYGCEPGHESSFLSGKVSGFWYLEYTNFVFYRSGNGEWDKFYGRPGRIGGKCYIDGGGIFFRGCHRDGRRN